MTDKKVPITCPLCGRKSEFPLDILTEGSTLQCPLCKVKLTIHGHMWEDIQNEIARMDEKS